MTDPRHSTTYSSYTPPSTSFAQYATPPSPSSIRADLDRATLERFSAAEALSNIQHYPIRARRPGQDPLADGISAVGSGLGQALLPMLQVPLPKGPENIGNPNCKGVKGIGGSMVQLAQTHEVVGDERRRYGTNQQRSAYSGQPPSPSPGGPLRTTSGPGQPVVQKEPSPAQTALGLHKNEETGFKTEFRFVVNEDAKTARNTVRQHVMREFRRRERWQQGKDKVTKAKKPSKKAVKVGAKAKAEDPLARNMARQPRLDSCVERETQPVPPAQSEGSDQKSLQTSSPMSMSASSDGSYTELKRFTSLLEADDGRRTKPYRPPFSQYVDQGVVISTEGVQEAADEIERAELSVLPYRQDPWAEVARAEINPFSSRLRIGAGPASRALLHHYAWVMPSLMDEIVTGTVFHRIGWLYSAVAVHDPTPYHTIIGFTLGHVAMLRGRKEPPMAIEHKEKSLSLINRRMANPLIAASDGSIGAIANIASYELIDCNPERFAMHMQGLARLITQRGGMSDFAMNPELEAVLVRLDIIRAYMTISQPRFPTWASLRSLTPLAVNIGPGSTEWFCPPAAYHIEHYLFAEDAIRLIHSLEEILLLMRSVSPTIPCTPDPSFKALLLDSVLHHFRRNIVETTSRFSNNVARRAIRLAGLVLLDIAAAEFYAPPPPASSSPTPPTPPSSAVTPPISSPALQSASTIRTPQSQPAPDPPPERTPGSARLPSANKGLGLCRLRTRFPAINQHRHTWGRSVEMILAVLLQADRMALERPFRAWYVADIVTLTMKLGEGEWRQVESVLMADIMGRVREERKQRDEARIRVMANANWDQGMEETGALEDYAAWDFGETVGRFWQEWRQ